MKDTTTHERSTLTALGLACAGAALCFVAAMGTLIGNADAGGTNDRSGSNGDNDWATDDEVIGSLPSMGDPSRDTLLLGLLLEEPPSFYIQGPGPELLRSIFSAEASAFSEHSYTTYEFVPTSRAGMGDLRITFHGDVGVAFDTSLLSVEGVEFGLALGMSSTVFGAGIVCNERVHSTTQMQSGDGFALPFSGLMALGLLHRVQVFTADGKGSRTALEVEQHGSMISLAQDVTRSGR
ncbi:MAG: hypothetical protein ABGY71_05470 [bacterium]|jgi:hypothetical protein|nr:hypothetical protein [Planctomycetota bacterium]HIL51835.1 hypothetical protein [Planctomycetota bacterium]